MGPECERRKSGKKQKRQKLRLQDRFNLFIEIHGIFELIKMVSLVMTLFSDL